MEEGSRPKTGSFVAEAEKNSCLELGHSPAEDSSFVETGLKSFAEGMAQKSRLDADSMVSSSAKCSHSASLHSEAASTTCEETYTAAATVALDSPPVYNPACLYPFGHKSLVQKNLFAYRNSGLIPLAE